MIKRFCYGFPGAKKFRDFRETGPRRVIGGIKWTSALLPTFSIKEFKHAAAVDGWVVLIITVVKGGYRYPADRSLSSG